MRKYLFLYLIPALLLGAISCQRDDDEPPVREEKEISRLYVSTSDYQAGASTNFYNVYIVDSVDKENIVDSIYPFQSAAKGGRTIHFAPSGSVVFQASMNTAGTNDTTIHVMRVNKQGGLSQTARISNRRYDNVRGLFYTVANNNSGTVTESYLLAANKSNIDQFGNLFVFRNPSSAGNYRVPSFRIPLQFIPWGVTVYDKDVFMVKTGTDGGIVVYKGLTQTLLDKADTLLNISPSYTLTVKGSQNLRGISYSRVKDILVMTDYSIVGNVVSGGRILIFENFSSHVESKDITPSRIIEGPNTKLIQPMDVAIDSRENGIYIYVADPGEGAKRVFRYAISDNGDVVPNAEISIPGRTPESISLDAR